MPQAKKFTEKEYHKKFAVNTFNETRNYLGKTELSKQEKEKMLELAYTSEPLEKSRNKYKCRKRRVAACTSICSNKKRRECLIPCRAMPKDMQRKQYQGLGYSFCL